ncbi:putative stress response RCI peptide [Xylariaceae sp. FL1651]|nr:putative stress response RCI peptide [Xylariaceae sp. FL1651]
MCGPDLFLGLIAILFPPLAVWVKCGICSADSIINILLSMLGYVRIFLCPFHREKPKLTVIRIRQIPGLIHAWYVIAKFPESGEYEPVPQDYERGQGGSRVTYVFVPQPVGSHPQQQQQQRQPKPDQNMNYGTAASNNTTTSTPSHQNDEGSGSNDRAPPTYAEAVKGDNKIQTHD